MRRIVLSLALALAPLAGCASTPVYGPWVIADYCGNHLLSDTLAWSRIEAPANAQAYREIAGADRGMEDFVPDHAREFWFRAASGEVKFCLTNLQRTGRRDWCDTQFAAWWIFRETDTGLSYSGDGLGICVT